MQKKSGSPTQRSLEYLRKAGYTVQVVERWNAFAKIRVDLFRCIDILAIRPGEIVGIQTTSAGNLAARVNKISELPEALAWIEAGGKLYVHGWKQKRNKWLPKGKGEWIARIVEITAE